MTREVMQQALEALEVLGRVMQTGPTQANAITALRTALAEPQEKYTYGTSIFNEALKTFASERAHGIKQEEA